MPFQLIHITLQYSNAVLLATLPHISDFAKKLDLPIPIPITTNHVQKFQPQRTLGDVGGWLTLTNGFQFWYAKGFVDSFDSPRNFYSAQKPEKIPEFYGKLKMTKKEAVELAKKTIGQLGYEKDLVIGRRKLEVLEPSRSDTNVIPFYEVRWLNPKDVESAEVRFDIDAENKKIVGMFLSNQKLWRPEPKIDVPVELEVDYQKRIRGQTNLISRTNAPQKLPKSPP